MAGKEAREKPRASQHAGLHGRECVLIRKFLHDFKITNMVLVTFFKFVTRFFVFYIIVNIFKYNILAYSKYINYIFLPIYIFLYFNLPPHDFLSLVH